MISENIILAALAILTLGLLGVVKFWPQGGVARTFSQHVANQQSSIVYYIALFTISLPMLSVFFYGWFVPHYELSFWYSAALATALAAQYLCTFFPESRRTLLTHQILALISATAMLVSHIIFITSAQVSTSNQIITIVSIVIMAILLITLVYTKARHPKILFVQIGYFAIYFLNILTLTYL